jgi:hypothetical protein
MGLRWKQIRTSGLASAARRFFLLIAAHQEMAELRNPPRGIHPLFDFFEDFFVGLLVEDLVVDFFTAAFGADLPVDGFLALFFAAGNFPLAFGFLAAALFDPSALRAAFLSGKTSLGSSAATVG